MSHYSSPPKHDCEAVVEQGLPAIAKAVSIDAHLNELNDLGINFMDGGRDWDVLDTRHNVSDTKTSVTSQTLETVIDVLHNIGCRAEFEVSETEVKISCTYFDCKLGEIAVGGSRVSSHEKKLDVHGEFTQDVADEADHDFRTLRLST